MPANHPSRPQFATDESRAPSPAERELARIAEAHRGHLQTIAGHRTRIDRLREELTPEASAQAALNAVAAAEAADLSAWTAGDLPKPRDDERAAAEATLRAATQRANAARSAIAKAEAEIMGVGQAITRLLAGREHAISQLLEEMQGPTVERAREAAEVMREAEGRALAIHRMQIERAHALPDGHPVKLELLRSAEVYAGKVHDAISVRTDVAGPLAELAASIAEAGGRP